MIRMRQLDDFIAGLILVLFSLKGIRCQALSTPSNFYLINGENSIKLGSFTDVFSDEGKIDMEFPFMGDMRCGARIPCHRPCCFPGEPIKIEQLRVNINGILTSGEDRLNIEPQLFPMFPNFKKHKVNAIAPLWSTLSFGNGTGAIYVKRLMRQRNLRKASRDVENNFNCVTSFKPRRVVVVTWYGMVADTCVNDVKFVGRNNRTVFEECNCLLTNSPEVCNCKDFPVLDYCECLKSHPSESCPCHVTLEDQAEFCECLKTDTWSYCDCVRSGDYNCRCYEEFGVDYCRCASSWQNDDYCACMYIDNLSRGDCSCIGYYSQRYCDCLVRYEETFCADHGCVQFGVGPLSPSKATDFCHCENSNLEYCFCYNGDTGFNYPPISDYYEYKYDDPSRIEYCDCLRDHKDFFDDIGANNTVIHGFCLCVLETGDPHSCGCDDCAPLTKRDEVRSVEQQPHPRDQDNHQAHQITRREGEAAGDNTFQAVIITDGNQTFVMFNYASINLINFLGDDTIPGVAGFDSTNSFGEGWNHKFSWSRKLQKLLRKSNMGRPGSWLYKVDGDKILSPDDC